MQEFPFYLAARINTTGVLTTGNVYAEQKRKVNGSADDAGAGSSADLTGDYHLIKIL